MAAPGAGHGAAVLAKSLKTYGVEHVFGIVGVPIIEVGMAIQGEEGINYIGGRNEQALSMAAQAVGALTQKPGGLLVVSGPGATNALTGLDNARQNNYPMILIMGSSDKNQSGMNAFQEADQLEMVRPYVKYCMQIDSVERIPFHIEKAVRISVSGQPGPVCVELPGDLVNKEPNWDKVYYPPANIFPVVKFQADDAQIDKAVDIICNSKAPLVIVGEQAQYYKCEEQLLTLLEAGGIPFLPMPSAKGLIDDDHPQNVIAARSTALKGADCVVLVGTRLNWMLHFGTRFQETCKVIHIDINPDAIGDNYPIDAKLIGTIDLVVDQLNKKLFSSSTFSPLTGEEQWWDTLANEVENNLAKSQELFDNRDLPMNYYAPLKLIQDVLEEYREKICVVSEGSNTMDIFRTINNCYTDHLNAGIYGTMGTFSGNALAASLVFGDTKRVVCVVGDSAFGFSGMEIETMARFKLPVIIIIINNSGIAFGLPIEGETREERLLNVPANSLGTGGETHYERIAEAFDGKGYYVTKHDEVQPALRDALKIEDRPSIINVVISPFAGKKKSKNDWLTRSDTSSSSKL